MRLALSGRHFDITPAVRRMVDTKLARLERMLKDSALSAQVVLSQQKNGYRADVMLHARGEKFLHGLGVADTLQGCVGAAFDKISQQAQKVKGKWQDRKRHGPQKDGADAVAAVVRRGRRGTRSASSHVASETPEPVAVRMPRILRSSRQDPKEMSVAEAARQLDGSDGVVVFRDVETAAVSVLYRSSSGELTLVETT
jgi:ribosomal subunit interface protein